MKWWTILAVVLVIGLGRGSADYMVIKVDVNKNYFKATAKPQGPGGFPMRPGGFRPGGGNQPQPNFGMPGQQGKGKESSLPPRWVYAYLEVNGNLISHPQSKPTHVFLNHPWGKNCLVPLDLIRFPYSDKEIGHLKNPSVKHYFDKELKLKSKDKNLPALLVLAKYALEHNLLKNFHGLMATLQKEDNPPPPVKAALAAYARIKEAMKKIPGDNPAQASLIADLQNKGFLILRSEQGHYTLLSKPPHVEGLKRRLALLEETFEKFYYWFALHAPESVPPLPKYRLLAVLADNDQDPAQRAGALRSGFFAQHVDWGSVPLVGDGFLPRRENVLFLCGEHLDDTYALLKKNNLAHLKKVGTDELLSGSVWGIEDVYKGNQHSRVWSRPDLRQDWLNTAYLQTLVLVQKYLEAEAERATISHLGTRQLLFANGLLPRNVEVPEWIQYGLASFFETPPGAFYPGVGLPSWSNLIDFKYHLKKMHLGSPEETLLLLVSDRYFKKARAAAALLDGARDNREMLADKAEQDQEVARSTAWALIYFLARNRRLHYLMRYSQELDRLPRDLELREKVLLDCFLRAFDVRDAGGLQRFAETWFSEMDNYGLEISGYGTSLLEARLEGQLALPSRPRPLGSNPGTVATPPGFNPRTVTTPPGFNPGKRPR